MTTQRERQSAWNPGLENGEESLFEAYRDMPKDTAHAVPWYVMVLENPQSPVALPGAIDLLGHDCIHIVLGRGLMAQDEAFVLGFTMGAAGNCESWQRNLFLLCARGLYRGPFRFSQTDGEVFQFAFEAAVNAHIEPLHQQDYRGHFHHPVSELRKAIGLAPRALRMLYEIERTCWPDSSASRRLPRPI